MGNHGSPNPSSRGNSASLRLVTNRAGSSLLPCNPQLIPVRKKPRPKWCTLIRPKVVHFEVPGDKYLLQNAVGAANAKPIDLILAHLDANGIHMNGSKFQTTILAETREGGIFIGSGQHGYFLIETEQDAQSTHAFYTSRIASEVQRIARLEHLSTQNGWHVQ